MIYFFSSVGTKFRITKNENLQKMTLLCYCIGAICTVILNHSK
jgi:hypothetical protein